MVPFIVRLSNEISYEFMRDRLLELSEMMESDQITIDFYNVVTGPNKKRPKKSTGSYELFKKTKKINKFKLTVENKCGSMKDALLWCCMPITIIIA
jgi:hypothetical protein